MTSDIEPSRGISGSLGRLSSENRFAVLENHPSNRGQKTSVVDTQKLPIAEISEESVMTSIRIIKKLAVQRYVFFLLLCVVLPVFCQTSTGTISITVSDTTGAVIPGAAISITGSDTGNVVRTLESNGEGLATAPLLPPGNYDVTVSGSGFKRTNEARISVNVGQTVDLRIHLEAGSTQQTVTVSGSAPLIEDKTSSLAQVISSRQILQLPLNGRNYLNLANLTAGAVPTIGVKDSSFSAYGNTGLQNAFLLDGARNVSYLRGLDNNARDMVRPPLDTLVEFSVQTLNFSAQYGDSAGAVVNAITRSGTNAIHGSAYDFLQNNQMNAINFFAISNPLLVQNQFGGSLGGPIKRDHAWIFGGYEQLNTHDDVTYESAVPSLANRAGNFGSTPIYNPFSTVANPSGGGDVRALFPNNTIPPADFSPITAKLLDAYPAPNVPGSSTLFSYNSPQISTTGNGVIRGDVQVTSKDSMFARFSSEQVSVLAAAELPLPTQTPVHRTIASYGVGYGYTRQFSTSLVNELRFSWTRIDLQSDATQPLNQIVPGSLDVPAIDSSIPLFNMAGFATIGAQAICCSNSPLHKTSAAWDFSNNLSKMVGRHSLEMGGEVLLIRPSTEAALNGRGTFGFTGVFTQNPQDRASTGSSVADFLLGTANTATTVTNVQFVERGWYIGGYLQDNWTVSKSLTLNLGIRYEYISPYTETHNKMANFIETPGDPNFGSYILAGDPRYPRSLVRADKRDFSPRIGFAYRVPSVSNLVVRGAYGIFYAQDPGIGVNSDLTANPPFFSYGGLDIVSDQLNPSTGFLVVPGATIPRLPPINPSTFRLEPSSTTTLQSWADHMSTPYVQEWNLTIEKQLPWNMVWATSYVGSLGIHRWTLLQGNQPLTNGPGSPTSAARRPLAKYTIASINHVVPIGTSTYNGISSRLEKRFSSGVSFLAAFTHGRDIDTQDYDIMLSSMIGASGGTGGGGDTVQNSYNLAAQRGPSDNNIASRFSLGGEWELPLGRNKPYLGTSWLAEIVGGWGLDVIYQKETGAPFTPLLSFDNANAGTSSWPNRVCNGNISNPKPSAWFNTSCFITPPRYQFGNTGRNVLYAPGVDNLDSTLRRDFTLPIRKPTVLQLRLDTFNTLNHPQFGQPGNILGTPTYGVVTSTSINNRTLQLAARLSF
jgi:hypothetical protein